MSFINDDTDLDDVDDDTQTGDDTTPQGLRRAAAAGKAAKAEATRLARENAMLKAGIDVDTPAGKMFAKAYDGELSKDAVKAAWAELGVPAPVDETPPADPPAADAETDTPPVEDSTAQRQALANGAIADTAANKQPVPADIAMQSAYDAVMARGGKREDAFAAGLAEIIASDDPSTFIANAQV